MVVRPSRRLESVVVPQDGALQAGRGPGLAGRRGTDTAASCSGRCGRCRGGLDAVGCGCRGRECETVRAPRRSRRGASDRSCRRPGRRGRRGSASGSPSAAARSPRSPQDAAPARVGAAGDDRSPCRADDGGASVAEQPGLAAGAGRCRAAGRRRPAASGWCRPSGGRSADGVEDGGLDGMAARQVDGGELAGGVDPQPSGLHQRDERGVDHAVGPPARKAMS